MSRALALVGKGLRRSFPRSGFELSVDRVEAPAGKALALLGPSGSGKTTLLHLLALLDRPDDGRVLLGGQEVSPRDRVARLQMAAVFQRPHLFKGSVEANVAYGLSVRGVPRPQRRPRVAAALQRVGLAGYERRSAASLSSGEAQRVSLARALVLEPRVLLLDEPLASLDLPLRRCLARDFSEILRAAAVTVVWVTHDQDEATLVADRVAILREGRIQANGATDEVMTLPDDAWTATFLDLEVPQEAVLGASEGGHVQLCCGGATILAVGEGSAGARARFSVRPEDVQLVESDLALPEARALNKLPGRVVACQARGAISHVVVDLGGARLAASVSRFASTAIGIAPGVAVTAIFRAAAVRWRPARPPVP